MGRRRTYSRHKKIHFGRIIFLMLIIVSIVVLGIKMFTSTSYVEKIDEILSSKIITINGEINNISSVDLKVYSNNGIKYTNKHENIIGLNNFDSSIKEDIKKVEIAKTLLDKVKKLEKADTVNDLAVKQNGYYWIEINVVVEEKKLIFNTEEDYNFDLYYDIAEQKIYIKNKYYDEFSNKNNKAKLESYKADDEVIKIIKELAELS